MFLLYHSDRCNTTETVFHWCYFNDLHTTCAVVCWVTTLRCPVSSSSFNTAREEKVFVAEVDLEPPAPQYSQALRSWSGKIGRRASSVLPACEPAGGDQWRHPPGCPNPIHRRRAPGQACGRRHTSPPREISGGARLDATWARRERPVAVPAWTPRSRPPSARSGSGLR
jgi:hypothetical protein